MTRPKEMEKQQTLDSMPLAPLPNHVRRNRSREDLSYAGEDSVESQREGTYKKATNEKDQLAEESGSTKDEMDRAKEIEK